MGELNSAVAWLGGALQCDPKRAIAYLNRGDVFVALSRSAQSQQISKADLEHICTANSQPCIAEASPDYAKFLELAPNSKSAPGVKKKLDALPPSP